MAQMKQALIAAVDHIVWEVTDTGYLEDIRAGYQSAFKTPEGRFRFEPRNTLEYRLAKGFVHQVANTIEPHDSPVCYETVVDEWASMLAESFETQEDF